MPALFVFYIIYIVCLKQANKRSIYVVKENDDVVVDIYSSMASIYLLA